MQLETNLLNQRNKF